MSNSKNRPNDPLQISFSQANLQDYVDCRRRFQLRYLLKVQWPAIESEPAVKTEEAMQQGAQFHRLAQQHLVGIPAERLTPLATGESLNRWWQNYLQFQEQAGLRKLTCRPEITLTIPFNNHRLIAKYDLLLIHPDGQLTIYDWKTSRKKPKRQWLLERLQSRVYPHVLAQAGAHLLPKGKTLSPSCIKMIYWFAEEPHNLEKITYNIDKHTQDKAYLTSLISEISELAPQNFHLTPHKERCRFCLYRSLCDRGHEAGHLDEREEEPTTLEMTDLDFEQITEISI